MKSTKIGNSQFTIKWLEELLREKSKINASIKDFSVTEVGVGQGVLSQILIVKITWSRHSHSLPTSVALKIPMMKQILKKIRWMPDDSKIKQAAIWGDYDEIPVAKAHKCEVAVYSLFNKSPPPLLKVPRFYFGRKIQKDMAGVLVLEDLSKAVGSTYTSGLTCGQMIEVAHQLAALHAYSLKTHDWHHHPSIKNTHTTLLDPSFPPTHRMIEMTVPVLLELSHDLFEHLAHKLLQICKSEDDINYVYGLNGKLGLPDILCNGDLNAQNLMWVKSEDGKPTDQLVAIIDWQIAHPGNVAEDFARLFASSVHADIRRKHFLGILRHYYECLSDMLGKPPPFSFEKLLESYKRCFKFGALSIIPAFPLLVKMMGDDDNEKSEECLLRLKAMIEDTVAYQCEFDIPC